MTILQRSEDWHADRCGKVTASRIKDVDAKPIKGKAHNALTLTILTERLTGVQEETKTNSLMQWGIDQEPYAIAAYENETGNFVIGTGLIDHPVIKMSGASPDGLVGKDGQIEAKCPSSQTHLNTILTKEVPAEYVPQITWQLACTRRKWCDFVSYDPRFPMGLQLMVVRVRRDADEVKRLESEAVKFLDEVAAIVADLESMKEAA